MEDSYKKRYEQDLLEEEEINEPVMVIPENAPIRKFVPQPVKDVENLVIEYLSQMKNRYNKYSVEKKKKRDVPKKVHEGLE